MLPKRKTGTVDKKSYRIASTRKVQPIDSILRRETSTVTGNPKGCVNKEVQPIDSILRREAGTAT